MSEIKYQFENFIRWLIDIKCRLKGNKRDFYCQSDIEGNRKCITQCEHCKSYYKPLEDNKI